MIAIPSSINNLHGSYTIFYNLHNLLIVGHYRSYFSFFTPGDKVMMNNAPMLKCLHLQKLPCHKEVPFIETLILYLGNLIDKIIFILHT